jgi:hypothetical protein
MVLGFSFSGATIEIADGSLLLDLGIDGIAGELVCIESAILSDDDGSDMLMYDTAPICFTLPEVALDITYNFDQDITGFQFDLAGLSVVSASGGAAAAAGFDVSFNGETVIGFNITGASIARNTDGGEGILTTLMVNGDVSASELSNVILSDVTPETVETTCVHCKS